MKTTSTKTRKAPKAVHGTVRLSRPCDETGHHGSIFINRICYLLETLADGGFRLMRVADEGKVVTYQQSGNLLRCDCPDATYRPRKDGCKHCRALAALRAANKIA